MSVKKVPIFIIAKTNSVIAWLESKGINGSVLKHLNPADVVPGAKYYGVMPIPLINAIKDGGAECFYVDIPRKSKKQKPTHEMSPKDIDEVGGCIYEVTCAEIVQVETK